MESFTGILAPITIIYVLANRETYLQPGVITMLTREKVSLKLHSFRGWA